MLDRTTHGLDRDLLLETVEVCAYKVAIPADGACIFTGKTAIYTGPESHFDDGQGHLLLQGNPVPICDKTEVALSALAREDIVVTASTWHYGGGGCC